MLDTFTLDTFRPRLGELFYVVVNGQRLPIKLTDVTAWGAGQSADRRRVPFTLTFHTVPQAMLRQGTYRVESDDMPGFELFLVPLDPDERGMRYQAVFA